MPNNKPTDINAAIAQLVSEQIASVLEPYRTVLDRMTTLLGAAPAPAPRAPRAPRAAAPAAVEAPKKRRGRKPGKRRAAKATEAAAPVNFEIGQAVMYRQGRGAFEAKVLDIAGDVLTLERAKDGLKITRPAAKVIAAP